MKVRTKPYNEIIDVECGSDGRFYTDHDTVYDYNELEFDPSLNPIKAEDLVISPQDTTPCDLWEERRWQAILQVFTACISLGKDEAIKTAIKYADALIAELKK